ncbi:MAG: hypothetical protein LBF97_00700 [Elusimicrobiota bacterium]|jgi:hypothetical protein|nr:hypothetical protein [Elusimicrobiota bacterium]
MKNIKEFILDLVEKISNDLENKIITEEGATLRKFETGLPVNIFIDDGGLWKKGKHWKRIKFQADKGNKPYTKNMPSMTIEDEPKIIEKRIKVYLTSKEIEQIKKFVKINKNLLLDLENIGIKKFMENMEKI